MSFPDLPSIQRDSFNPDYGDEVETMLFLERIAASSGLVRDPDASVEDIMRENLTNMLESARQKKDEEHVSKFQSALDRLHRFCNG